MKYVVDVTRDDINKGNPKQGDRCPVALAVQRQTPYTKAHFGTMYYYLDGLTMVEGARYRIPLKLSEFIYKFDEGEKVKPFTFTLTISEPTIEVE